MEAFNQSPRGHRQRAHPTWDLKAPTSRQFLIQQQVQGIADAEAGGVGRDMRQTALVSAGSEINMDPGNIPDEALQEPGGQYVIGIPFQDALLDVGDTAFQSLVKQCILEG